MIVSKTSVAVGFLLLSCAGCAVHAPRANPLAADLSREDQASRSGEVVSRTDEQRIHLMLAELADGRIRTAEDRFNAALVLQHSPLTFRDGELVAISPDNYLLAHHLAKSAFADGYERARRLVAQTIDRYLSLTAGQQKYGTNLFLNQQKGIDEWAPIDRHTTDAERALFGVPPLAELLRQAPERVQSGSQGTPPRYKAP